VIAVKRKKPVERVLPERDADYWAVVEDCVNGVWPMNEPHGSPWNYLDSETTIFNAEKTPGFPERWVGGVTVISLCCGDPEHTLVFHADPVRELQRFFHDVDDRLWDVREANEHQARGHKFSDGMKAENYRPNLFFAVHNLTYDFEQLMTDAMGVPATTDVFMYDKAPFDDDDVDDGEYETWPVVQSGLIEPPHVHVDAEGNEYVLPGNAQVKNIKANVVAAIYTCENFNVVFRDSLMLMKMPLKKACEDYMTAEEFECYGKTEGWDYTKIRHLDTPLTSDEMMYCRNDVAAMAIVFPKYLATYGVTRPSQLKYIYTNTGFASKALGDYCMPYTNTTVVDDFFKLSKQKSSDLKFYKAASRKVLQRYVDGDRPAYILDEVIEQLPYVPSVEVCKKTWYGNEDVLGRLYYLGYAHDDLSRQVVFWPYDLDGLELGAAPRITVGDECGGDIAKSELAKFCKVRDEYFEERSDRWQYSNFMNSDEITEESVEFWHEAMRGGLSMISNRLREKILNAASLDVTSQYPCVLLSKKFPYGPDFPIPDDEKFKRELLLSNYYNVGFTARMRLKGIRMKGEGCLPFTDKSAYNNPNRITGWGTYMGDYHEYEGVFTFADWMVWRDMATFESVEIIEGVTYQLEYVPKRLVQFILKLYEDKTRLKGVTGEEYVYAMVKAILNSVSFGKFAQYPLYPQMVPDETGRFHKAEASELRAEHRRFNYRIGVMIPAYARLMMYNFIGDRWGDTIQVCTDAVYFDLPYSEIKRVADDWNKEVRSMWVEIAKRQSVNIEQFCPSTVKGVPKLLGEMEIEHDGKSLMFVARSKTYWEYDWRKPDGERLILTTAGKCKKELYDEVMRQAGGSEFDAFNYLCNNRALFVEAGKSGRKSKLLVEYDKNNRYKDYRGVWGTMPDKRGMALIEMPTSIVHESCSRYNSRQWWALPNLTKAEMTYIVMHDVEITYNKALEDYGHTCDVWEE